MFVNLEHVCCVVQIGRDASSIVSSQMAELEYLGVMVATREAQSFRPAPLCLKVKKSGVTNSGAFSARARSQSGIHEVGLVIYRRDGRAVEVVYDQESGRKNQHPKSGGRNMERPNMGRGKCLHNQNQLDGQCIQLILITRFKRNRPFRACSICP